MDSNANVATSKSSLLGYFVGRYIFRIIWQVAQEKEVENECSETTNFIFMNSGPQIVRAPLSTNPSIRFNRSIKSNLTGYDGITDYAGSSGSKSISDIATEAATRSISDIGNSLARSLGESIILPAAIHVKSRTESKGTFSSVVLSKDGAEVCVSHAHDLISEEGGQQWF